MVAVEPEGRRGRRSRGGHRGWIGPISSRIRASASAQSALVSASSTDCLHSSSWFGEAAATAGSSRCFDQKSRASALVSIRVILLMA